MNFKNLLKKLDLTLWTLVLFVWSFPTGFLFMLMTQPMIKYEQNLLILITGGIAILIALGGFSYLVYRISKSLDLEKPYRNALIFYTAFLIFFFALSYFSTNKGLEKEKRDSLFSSVEMRDKEIESITE